MNIGENGLINNSSLPPSFTAYFGTLHGVVEYFVDPPALGNQHCHGDGPTHINGRMLHLVVVAVVNNNNNNNINNNINKTTTI